jgi:hypothetical protein
LYYIGPFALIFTFCDYTQHVAKAWINLSLAVAWTGVFGSIALLISVKGGVLTGVEQGIGSNDWISTAVYSLSSLLLLTLSFPIAQYFFGAMGSGLSNSPSSMVRGAGSAAGGAFTAGAATASVAGKVMSKIGSTINKSGSKSNASFSSSGSSSATDFSSGSGGSSNASSSNQSFTASGGTGATASTVPTNRLIMGKIGTALTKGGDFLNKAGKDALRLSEINSNMPRDAVKKVENIIDGNAPEKSGTPGNGKETA